MLLRIVESNRRWMISLFFSSSLIVSISFGMAWILARLTIPFPLLLFGWGLDMVMVVDIVVVAAALVDSDDDFRGGLLSILGCIALD